MIYLSRDLLNAFLNCLIVTCLRCLSGNVTVICDRLATILGWAELTSMLSCDGWRNHYPHPFDKALEHFQEFVLEKLSLFLVGMHVKHFHFDVEVFLTKQRFFICASTTWHCDFFCEIVMSWLMVVPHVWKYDTRCSSSTSVTHR